ncbi:helix-turn-helix domain-containing protein [Rhizocola hellebori]|nr:helix-turn-helix transcriptional regulator [Rhizocola hellebori]
MLVRLDLKQSELAARLGVNEMWLSRRLRGAQPIDLNDLQRIAETLGVEVTDLLPRPNEGRTVATAGEPARTAAYATGGAASRNEINVR